MTAEQTHRAVQHGSFVAWRGRIGRVNLLVTDGPVPGVTATVVGTAAAPAARVAVWTRDDQGWSPSGHPVAVKAAELLPVEAPALAVFADTDAANMLVALHAEHSEVVRAAGGPRCCVPDPAAVKEAYRRGLRSYPPDAVMPVDQWALQRVALFLALAAGMPDDEFHDGDLLPEGHPLRG